MRLLLAMGPLLLLWACSSGDIPDYRRVEVMPHEWTVAPEGEEHCVSEPMYYEDLKDYCLKMQAEGWSVARTEPVGEDVPQRYLVVLLRPKGQELRLEDYLRLQGPGE